MDFLSVPLGYLISLINGLVGNYGFSIVIFTIILKFLMFPFYIKQQKSIARMSVFNPLINEINKKYSSNLQKRNEELQKFYSNYNLNPGAGCLTTIVPMIFFIGMYGVVMKPLNFVLNMDSEIINKAIEIFKNFHATMFAGLGPRAMRNILSTVQLGVINDALSSPDHYQVLGSKFLNSINSFDLNFLGLNLSEKASLTSITLIVPILSMAFSFLQMLIMIKQNNMQTNVKFGKVIMYVSPIFSFFIGFSAPLALSIYWMTNYVVQIFQSLFLNKFCNFEDIKKQTMLELDRIRKNKKSDGLTSKQSKISNKERLNLARKHLQNVFDD